MVTVRDSRGNIGAKGAELAEAFSQLSDTELVARWREGQEGAATEIYRRYVARLLKLVELRISGGMSSRVGAEDVVQSAFRSIFARLRRGEFEFKDDEQFWKLLVTIALNKWRNVVSHHHAAKRSLEREEALAEDHSADLLAASRLGRRATVLESVIFADLLEKVLEKLPTDEQQYLLLRLDGGYSQKEIAAQLDLSDRTVRRIADRIHTRVAVLAKQGIFDVA
jgi:RNA polymerase sigma-70 factor (ECF subfamily)